MTAIVGGHTARGTRTLLSAGDLTTAEEGSGRGARRVQPETNMTPLKTVDPDPDAAPENFKRHRGKISNALLIP